MSEYIGPFGYGGRNDDDTDILEACKIIFFILGKWWLITFKSGTNISQIDLFPIIRVDKERKQLRIVN